MKRMEDIEKGFKKTSNAIARHLFATHLARMTQSILHSLQEGARPNVGWHWVCNTKPLTS